MTLGDALLGLDVPEHRAGFFDALRDELEPRTRFSRPRLLLLSAAVAVVVAGTLAFGLSRGSDVASAAQVRAAVEHALASTGSISGILVSRANGDRRVGRARFVLSSTGAFQTHDLRTGGQVVYDPARRTVTLSDPALFVQIVGLPGGPPDAAPATFPLDRGLGAVVAVLANARHSTVENVTYDGRPAWRLRAPTGNPGEQETITVDRATGMPVRVQVFRDARLTSELRIERLRVSPTEPRIVSPVRGPHQNGGHFNAGFRRTSLAGAREAAGYSPLVPKELPHGFKLTEIAFASHSKTEGGGANPPWRDIVALTYRRGFDEIGVMTRRTGPDPSAWKDPLQVSSVVTPSPVTFTGGALAGERGEFVLDGLPHVWTVGPKLVVTVAGTIDRADLLKVANSLR